MVRDPFVLTISFLWVVASPITAEIELKVNAYPAIIYTRAPPDTVVLEVTASEVGTGSPISEVVLTDVADADYFSVNRQKNQFIKWTLNVNKTIDKPVGYQFKFNVIGKLGNDQRDREVRINVTQKNQFAPKFIKSDYSFLVLRDGVDHDLTHVGNVMAVDNDVEPYNSVFNYAITDPKASKYFFVDSQTGHVELLENLPKGITNMTFQIMAIDVGSPALLSSASLTVNITDVAPPDIFCVAVSDSVARICWKDPTNGSYVMKYELLFQMDGMNATNIPVHVNGIRDETCRVVRGDQLGRNYTFTVKVNNGLEWSTDSLQRKVRIDRKGLYGDCPFFSNCSVWKPCQNNGQCLTHDDLSYSCNCTDQWGGQNCTDVNLCATSPCNVGNCSFTGDRTFDCDCPSDHYGNYCEYFNICSQSPCQNGGHCIAETDGNFSCQCADNFVGLLCDERDPCTPQKCVHGVCNATDLFNYNCSCEEGYFGTHCENADVCILEKPCMQGTCHLSLLSTGSETKNYSCDCKRGYKGFNCNKLDMCDLMGSSLCKNNATCNYVEESSYKCLCTDGFWGGECQNYDPCFKDPCMSGHCRNISNTDYICDCGDGYFGRHCEHYDPCFSRPCHTDASVCHNISSTEYTCDCPEERFGKDCEHIDGCKINLCHNNASCTNISYTGDVECKCMPGYLGKFCNDYNPCSLGPCQNNATCINDTNSYTCKCANGFRGQLCDLPDPCWDEPCWNNGTCSLGVIDSSSYWCMCQSMFYGSHCGNVHFCQLEHGCQHGGICTILDGNIPYDVTLNLQSDQGNATVATVMNRYTCICLQGYTGKHCEKLSPCVNSPCGDGQCVQQGEGHICRCPDGTERLNCDEGYCGKGDKYDRTGHYKWPRTKSGGVVKVTCHHGHLGPKPYAFRECAKKDDGTTFWKDPVTSSCKELNKDDVSKNLRSLATFTRDASGLRSDEIANITNILEEYFFFSFDNLDIAKEMTMVVGNLLDANETVIIESNFRNHSSDRLLWLLDEYSDKVNTTNQVNIETDNIHLRVINRTMPQGVGYTYEPKLEETEGVLGKTGVSLKLPSEAIQSSDENQSPRIQLMTFRSSSFFIPEVDAPPQDVVMKQWVVSATVQGRKLTNLSSPVEIFIQNIEHGGNHTCVFWDEENRTWSTEGVVTVIRQQNLTRCYSYHLTSFAIVLDPSPEHLLSDDHSTILTFISYIGCGISIIGLTLTIVTYSIFRCLNREKSGKILLNMCSSMLLMNIVFILGSETSLSISGDVMCKAVAILLHYFLLSTLTWMLVEAINMYQALITVFTKYSEFFMLKRSVFAWGIPIIVVVITIAVDIDNYTTTNELCFLSQGNKIAFYVALMAPASLILLINICIFVLVSRVILKPKFKGQVTSTDALNPAQIRGAFTVMTLLGVTWVFGPLAISDAKVVVNYIFTILNSLQGFLIFVFRCCFNPEVRMAWLLLLKTGKFKRRKGPIHKMGYTSDTTSSKGDSKINGSYGDTMKSNLNTSVGKQRTVIDNNKHNGRINTGKAPSKNLNNYFDNLQRYRDANGGRSESNGNIRNEVVLGRRRANEMTETNGNYKNGVYNGGIATIYTGRQIDLKPASKTFSDDFTRL